MNPPTMFFRPNQHPGLHLGNGMVLYWSWLEAQRRGCQFILALEDDGCTSEERAKSLSEIHEAVELLGIKFDFETSHSSHKKTYDRTFRAFTNSPQARDWDAAKRGLILRDPVHGKYEFDTGGMTETLSFAPNNHEPYITASGVLIASFGNCCDFIAWRTPLHIRGGALSHQSLIDALMMKQMLLWLGARAEEYNGLEFAHLPIIHGDTLGLLQKSRPGMDVCWRFDTWALQYATVDERRRVLEAMITDGVAAGHSPTLADVVPASVVVVDSWGRRTSVRTVESGFRETMDCLRQAAFPINMVDRLPENLTCQDAETEFWNNICPEGME